MPIEEEKRAIVLEGTREMACAFLEDIEHTRKIVDKIDPSKGEIRRLSSLLRRLLVERDLENIASPRLLRKIKLSAPDNNPAYKAQRKMPFLFFASGRATILGGHNSTIWAFDSKRSDLPWLPQKSSVSIPTFDIAGKVDLDLKSFLSQKVLCYRGDWVNRGEVIKYVAHVASGVHSGSIKKPSEDLVAKIRTSSYLTVKEGRIHLELFTHGIDIDTTDFTYKPEAMDFVLIELLATATFLTQSEDVKELEEFIRRELSESNRIQ